MQASHRNPRYASQSTTGGTKKSQDIWLPATWSQHVALSAVCKHWRVVALVCPRFWATIPFSRSSRYPAMLSRSADSPRILSLSNKKSKRGFVRVFSESPVLVLLADLQWQLDGSKLWALHLLLSASRTAALLQHFPRNSAPLLCSFQIHCTVTDGDKPSLPAHVLTCSLPALRHLDLYQCNIPWADVGAFPSNLQSLLLVYPDTPCPHSLFFSILESSPDLEYPTWNTRLGTPDLEQLDLRRVLDPKIELSTLERPVPLLSLHTCTIHDQYVFFFHFYASVLWPEDLEVDAEITIRHRGAESSFTRFIDSFHSMRLKEKVTSLMFHNAVVDTMEGPGLTCTFMGSLVLKQSGASQYTYPR